MPRVHRVAFVVCVVGTLCGCRAKQPLVVHVYRNRSSTVGKELDRRFYEFNTQRISFLSGRQVVVATYEPSDYNKMLRDRIGSELLPELIVLDSPADAMINPTIEREAAHAKNICTAVRVCPAVVPAFIPSWVSNKQDLQAAQQVLRALSSGH
jgi:hypothetical protein